MNKTRLISYADIHLLPANKQTVWFGASTLKASDVWPGIFERIQNYQTPVVHQVCACEIMNKVLRKCSNAIHESCGQSFRLPKIVFHFGWLLTVFSFGRIIKFNTFNSGDCGKNALVILHSIRWKWRVHRKICSCKVSHQRWTHSGLVQKANKLMEGRRRALRLLRCDECKNVTTNSFWKWNSAGEYSQHLFSSWHSMNVKVM